MHISHDFIAKKLALEQVVFNGAKSPPWVRFYD